jgi:hypothetical protein
MGEGEREAILCADYHVDATRFKGLANLADDYELEYVSDEDNDGWVLESLNRCIGAVIDASASTLDTVVAQYLDWESAIDYYILLALVGGTDMVSKNFILATKDGVKWLFSAYDMDTTFGLAWDGKSFTAPIGEATFALIAREHRVFDLIKAYKTEALKQRYRELRSTIMSDANLFEAFVNFVGSIPSVVMDADRKLWPTIPNTSVNTVQTLLEWYRQRVIAIDAEVEALEPSNDTGTIKWITPIGEIPSADRVDDTTYQGGYMSEDLNYNSNALYIETPHINDGKTYKFSATFAAVTDGVTPRRRMLVQPLDSDGNVLTEGLTGSDENGGAMEYHDEWKGFYASWDSCTFKLSKNVAAFRTGFVWSAEPPMPGEKIVISDILVCEVSEDWLTTSGSIAAEGTVDNTTYPGGYMSKDENYATNALYLAESHANDGGEYKFGATYEAESSGLSCKKLKLVQLYDANGNVLTEGLTGDGHGVAMEYSDEWKGFYSNGDYCTFSLAENVASFRIGFVWSIEPPTPGENVIISNVYLETVD